MLQDVPAAHKISTARIFDREVAADYLDAATSCRASATRLTRIIAFAVIACGA
jgi:hypothetical protein